MRLMIHDLEKDGFDHLFPGPMQDVQVVSDNGRIRHCIGCFGCWVKTPGQCVLKDGYQEMGKRLSQTDKLIIISKCVYGGYSPFVKNVLDRSISYLLPFFQTIQGETHHKARYQHTFRFSACFYGENLSTEEKQIAEKMIHANCMSFHVPEKNIRVAFFDSPKAIII